MKEIFIERQHGVFRIAIKKNNKLKECFIEEDTKEPVPGEIYKATIKNVVPAIKCAFVDVGSGENCYMYMDRRFKNTNFKKGQEILVQVVKESLGTKGPKVTNAISIPGRYCVLNTLNTEINFSKKIIEEDIKKYIKENIIKPDDIGIMIRTNSKNVSIELLNDEIKKLYDIYKRIYKKATYSLKPGLLLKNGGILGRILRDKLDSSTIKLYVNNLEDYNEINEYISTISDINVFLELHRDERELFDFYGIEKEILKLRNTKVQLNCGGYIIIEKTEAMYVIDVNSGKNTSGNSMKKTAYITNIQAAEEVANQIRLRNLSGIILIDFIDMNEDENRIKVLDKLKEGFESDKNKTVIYPFTELNLVQIARRRMGKSIYDYIEEECKMCHGKGERLKLSYLSFLINNEIKKVNKQKSIKHIYIEINEVYKNDIKGDILNFIKDINALDKCVYLNFVTGDENFKVEPLLFGTQIENLKMYKVYG
ncbi:Rne/Rng family ribonuclease [Clostridium rectalis]|uniref:Rne/Rng family ribonuclease n=1 Tax=Clostridium rectalis TaxID=2040295 RepID=UPI000F62FB3D|nr:ribonuclease E/G [Clostridium rectalis]